MFDILNLYFRNLDLFIYFYFVYVFFIIFLFYILSGHLPFKGNKEIIIAEKIVNDDLDFDEEEWKKKSKNAKELISSCLKKEPDERITIDEFLNHPWIKKFKIQQKNSL